MIDTMSDRLEENQFTWKQAKDGKILVSWYGKLVRTYSGHKAASILREIENSDSDRDIQYALARVTGNFKRGNEKRNK